MDMDDMMNASFDQLRNEIAPASRSTVMPRGGRSMLTAVPGSAMGPMPALMGSVMGAEPRTLLVPDHKQELHVYLCGPGAKESEGVGVLDSQTTEAACKGKNDFILFEPLDDAVRQGRRLVLVSEQKASRGVIQHAQVYLAESLARWLSEQKTDGAGRPYGEVKDEDPTLRKHFTRAQINAIRAFGGA